MSRRDRRLTLPASISDAPARPEIAGKPPSERSSEPFAAHVEVEAEGTPVKLRIRLSAGMHAVAAAEVEILVDGTRIAGGNGIVEFNLWVESWVDIAVIRP